MQWIKTMSAKRWNKVHGVTGHLWGKRFWSRIVRGDNDVVAVCKYIDDNPVKAGLVKKAEDWVFGGLYHHRQGIKGVVDALEERILERLPQHRHVSSCMNCQPLALLPREEVRTTTNLSAFYTEEVSEELLPAANLRTFYTEEILSTLCFFFMYGRLLISRSRREYRSLTGL
jgi:putative transposase